MLALQRAPGDVKAQCCKDSTATGGTNCCLELDTCTCSIDDFKALTDRNPDAETSYVGGRCIDDHDKEGKERDAMTSFTSAASRSWQWENKTRSATITAECN